MNLTWQYNDRRRIHYVTLKKASTLSCVCTFKVTFSAFYNDILLRSALVMNGSLMRWASAPLSLVRTPYCLPSAMTCPRIRTPRLTTSDALFHSSDPATQPVHYLHESARAAWSRAPLPLILSFMLVGQKLGLKVETDHSGTFADLMCINVGADFIFPSRSALICFTLCTWLILQKCTIF